MPQKDVMKVTSSSIFATAFAYAILGVLALALGIPPGYASPVFPAAGLAVALVLYFDYRILPGIWLGSLVINLVVAWQNGTFGGISMVIAAVVACGAVLQAWVAGRMIRHWLGEKWRHLETEKDIALFLAIGGPLCCLLAATIGTSTLYVAGVISIEEFGYSWWNWWGGDTFGVLIFTPLTLIVLLRRETGWKERRIAVVLPMLVTLCLVVAAFFGASDRQQKQHVEKIEEHGKNISQLLDHRLIAHQEALAALKRLIEVMPDMTFDQFENFTRITLQDNKDIFALSYNPYLPHASRSVFEQTMARRFISSFAITERDHDKQLVPAREHPVYVPVGFIAPLDGNRSAIGYNIYSEAIRRDAIIKAFTTKHPAVTAPIQLVQEEQKRIGVLVLVPAYRRMGEGVIDDGIKTQVSFAVGVFKIDEMVRIATKNHVPAGIIFRLTDQAADADRSLLFQSDAGQNKPTEPYVWRTELTMADRPWRLEVFPTAQYLQQQHSSFGLVIGIAGLSFAALLQIMLLAMTGRTSVISRKVQEQTVQLTQSYTEAKRREQVLAEKKEELDAIIRNFLDTLIVVNTALVVVRVNKVTCDLLGFSEQELIGRSVVEFFHDTEEYVRSVFAFYNEEKQQQSEPRRELRNVELCYRHRNGDRLPMSFNISLLQDDNGIVTGVVAGAKDVSGLRLALDKIAGQKEYIETLFDIVPGGLLAISPSHTVEKYNLAFKRMLHFCTEHLGLTQAECADTFVKKILEQQSKSDTFTLCLGRDKGAAYFKCHSTVISVLEDVASVVSIEDITDERKAEEARNLLATVIEQTGDTIIIAGTDEVIQYINPAGLKNSGFNETELIGTTQHVFTDGLMDAAMIGELRDTIAGGRSWHGRFKSRRKDDSIIEEDVTVSPVRNEEGDLTHYVSIKRDITEMTLLQGQLLQVQKLEAIGRLAAGIAHEINTPMQYVQNNVTFFERAFADIAVLVEDYKILQEAAGSKLSDEARGHLQEIDLDFLLTEIPESIRETHGGINRVVKIVAAMKDFSHPGSDEKIATDINRALESTITVSRNEWKYVAEVHTDFDPDLPRLLCLPDQLNQAVLNLIINSAQAIEETGASITSNPGRISISTRHGENFVEIRISDSGGGIPEEIHNRIFDPFFTTKEVGKGTGQGLAIVHDVVVRKHGGRINVITDPAQGTTFVLRLPIDF